MGENGGVQEDPNNQTYALEVQSINIAPHDFPPPHSWQFAIKVTHSTTGAKGFDPPMKCRTCMP